MRVLIGITGVAAVAVATSFGLAQLQAATNPLLDYCPATQARNAGTCVAAANMMVAVGSPSDDELVAGVNAIAGQIEAGHTRGEACDDASAGIAVLAAGIDDPATRTMAETLGAALCGPGGASSGAAVASINSLSTPVTGVVPGVSSGSSVGQSSGGSVGQSSGGSVGQSSGGV